MNEKVFQTLEALKYQLIVSGTLKPKIIDFIDY